jgi:uncharacterized protein (TIGR03067 family)
MPYLRLSLALAFLYGLASIGRLAADPKDEAVAKDLKALEGEWQIKKLVVSDKDEDVKNIKESLIIKDGQYRIVVDGKDLETGKLKIDPMKSPKTLEFSPKEGAAVPAIYDLQGDMLKLARHQDSKQQPSAFSGKDTVVLTCERKKP